VQYQTGQQPSSRSYLAVHWAPGIGGEQETLGHFEPSFCGRPDVKPIIGKRTVIRTVHMEILIYSFVKTEIVSLFNWVSRCQKGIWGRKLVMLIEERFWSGVLLTFTFILYSFNITQNLAEAYSVELN